MIKVMFMPDLAVKRGMIFGITGGQLYRVHDTLPEDDFCLYVIADYIVSVQVLADDRLELFMYYPVRTPLSKADEDDILDAARKELSPKSNDVKFRRIEVEHGKMYVASPFAPEDLWDVYLYTGPDSASFKRKDANGDKNGESMSELDIEAVSLVRVA